MTRTTLRDIAKLSGVSHMTVSRVINNDPMVSLETRRKVMDVIQKCNYTPHASARALIRGETKVFGVLVLYDIGKFPADFLTTILIGVTQELAKEDYHISLHFDQLDGKHDLVSRRLLTANRMDGLFVLSVESGDVLHRRLSGIELPVVVINQQITLPGVSCVDADEFAGAHAVTTHFLKNGRRNIAFIGGDPLFSTSISRRQGYEAALVDFGLEPCPDLCGIGYFSSTGGREAARKILSTARKIDAIFAANDAMALGVMTALRDAGLSIPDDVALAGFDDNEFSAAVVPPLTTVRKNRVEMGIEAAKIMFESLSHQKTNGGTLTIRKTLPVKFVVRASSGGTPA